MRRKAVEQSFRIADIVGQGFRSLNIPLSPSLDVQAPAGVAYDDAGDIQLRFNPMLLYEQESVAEEGNLPPMFISRIVNGEELIHAADLVGNLVCTDWFCKAFAGAVRYLAVKLEPLTEHRQRGFRASV